jgi:hypothetical protein
VISGKSDVWSFGCVCVEILYWLKAQMQEDVLADPNFHPMWKPGTSFWKETLGGAGVLEQSFTHLLDIIKALESLRATLKRLAELATKCLSIDQETLITPHMLKNCLKAVFSASHTSMRWSAEPEAEPEDGTMPSSQSQTPEKTVSETSIVCFAASTGIADAAVAQKQNPSFLGYQTNAIHGWDMAEFGLGIELYIKEEVRQWQNVNAVQEIAPTPFVGHEDASLRRSWKLALPEQMDWLISTNVKNHRQFLLATRDLIQILGQWSRKQAQEEEVSNIHAQQENQFDLVCLGLNSVGVETSDLKPLADFTSDSTEGNAQPAGLISGSKNLSTSMS